jgi:branched-chain amino acid transport system substrate-binding protein
MKASVSLMMFPPKRRSAPVQHYRRWSLAALVAVLLSGWLAACSVGPSSNHTISLVTIFPASGASGAIGQSMMRAVDLAVKQHTALGGDYTLTVSHVNESSVTVGPDAAQAVTNAQVMGVVGPFGSQAVVAALPALAQAGVVTISPTATLPGLTKADQATAEGLTFSQSHPKGKPISFFRLTADDNAIGAAAADLALAAPAAHGLGSHAVFVVDDGSPSGKAQSAAFQSELKAGHGAVAGSRSVALGNDIGMQTTVSAIIEANPDSVYFAGDAAVAADLRRTLTQTGAPRLVILTSGAAANDPAWGDSVGAAVLAGYTVGLLPTQALAKLSGAQAFQTAYESAYPGAKLTPQSALAYDAAMVEINAIKSLITAQKTPTRAAVLSAVAATKYAGVTGQIAFDKNGDPVTPPSFSVYTCDTKGAWAYQTSIAAKASAG